MKIIMVNDFYTPYSIGGTETFVRLLALSLRGRGHEVSILTARIGDIKEKEEIEGIQVFRFGKFPELQKSIRLASGTAPGHLTLQRWNEFGHLINELSPDVIHFHNTWLLGPDLMKVKGYPKGVTFHDYWPFCIRRSMVRVGGGLCEGPGKVACRICRLRAPSSLYSLDLVNIENERRHISSLLQTCDFLVAASNYVASRTSKFSSIDTKVVRYGIPIPSVAYNNTKREGYVLFAGRGTKAKGINILLTAFSRDELKKQKLLIASNLRQPRQENIKVLGWQSRDNLLELMSKAMCVVVPSLWPEPFGLVALEAQSVGTPAIVSKTGGLQELVENQNTGLLIPPGDINGLVNAILKISSDEVFQDKVRQTGPKFVMDNYSIEKVIDEWENIYAASI